MASFQYLQRRLHRFYVVCLVVIAVTGGLMAGLAAPGRAVSVDAYSPTQPTAKQIQGVVTRSDSGATVADAEVSAFNIATEAVVWTTTDANGNFTLTAAAGEWEVQVEPQVGAPWVYNRPPVLVRFAAGSAAETRTVALVVEAATGVVTGQVLDPTGAPIVSVADINEDITVDLWSAARNAYSYGYLEPDGTFAISVAPGRYDVTAWLDETIYPDWYAGITSTVGVIEVSSGVFNIGDIHLVRRDATVEGEVLDDQGNPLVGAWVEATAPNDVAFGAETDEDGWYELPIGMGSWRIDAFPPDGSNYLPAAPVLIMAQPAAPVVTVDFTQALAASAIDGVVVDQNQTPLTGVEATAYVRRSDSPEYLNTAPVVDGVFHLQAPAGDLRVGLALEPGSAWSFLTEATPAARTFLAPHEPAAAAAAEMAPFEQAITLAPGESDATVQLMLVRNNARIQGRLVDETGAPVTGVSGYVAVAPAGGGASWQEAAIDELDGSYQLDVATGAWNLSYELDTTEYMDGSSQTTALTVGSNLTVTHDITLTELGLPIRLRVQISPTESAGSPLQPLAATYVWVRCTNPPYESMGLTDASGEVTLRVPGGAAQSCTAGTAVQLCRQVNQQEGAGDCLTDAVSQPFSPGGVRERAGDVMPFIDMQPNNRVGQGLNGITGVVTRASDGMWIWFAYVELKQVGVPRVNWTLSTIYGLYTVFYWVDEPKPTDRFKAAACYYERDWRVTCLFMDLDNNAIPIAPKASQVMTGSVDMNLQPVGVMAPPVAETFQVAEGWDRVLADGSRIQIPRNAVPTTEQAVKVTVEPTVLLPGTPLYHFSRYAYKITLVEAVSGKVITQNLRDPARITFRYGGMDLDKVEIADPTLLRPALFSGDLWLPASGYTLDTANAKIQFQTRQLGDWGLVVPEDVQTTDAKMYLPLVRG